MEQRKYEKFISGITDTTDTTAGFIEGHGSGTDSLGPRYRLLWDNIVPDSDIKVLVRHILGISSEYPDYVERHIHDVSKVYILLSEEPGTLEEEVTLGDEKYAVKSPAAIFVPAGLEHHIKFMKGHGLHIMVMPTKGSYNEHTFPVSKK
jgi:2-isopropylmalate synthase